LYWYGYAETCTTKEIANSDMFRLSTSKSAQKFMKYIETFGPI